MRIVPVWFPGTSFKSILEPTVSNEAARVYHDNDQCSVVRFAHNNSPVPYSGSQGLTHCFHCQQLHERRA